MSEGVSFGNYRLLRRLARGGMAEVFLARQQGVEGFERRVAIKRILPHLSDSAEFRTMFLDEARLAAQLSHPNIIHIYDFGKVEDYYFIAMEYVDGVDLGRLIKQARTLPVPFEIVARIMADICAGLHYAHNITDGAGKRLNVVHRDVTPQNVLVTYDGIVKVVDFGIAKATWQASRTRPGVVKGKYAYMSPEQVEGRALDARSDIFSVGICLYELLTGMPLYRRDNVTEAMKEIRDGKPIHPEQHRSDIPSEIIVVLKRALSTSRDDRYPTAASMQLDLERYLKAAKGLATPQVLGDYLRQEVPRGPDGELLSEPKAEDGSERHEPRGVVKGGTAPISGMSRQAITPAYESMRIEHASDPGDSTREPDASVTTPGKHVRATPAPMDRASTSERRLVPPGSGFGDLDADDDDEDLTRQDEPRPNLTTGSAEQPTTRTPKFTPPAGEHPVSSPGTPLSGSEARISTGERSAARSAQHGRSRSGPFPGSPLGGDVSDPARDGLHSERTAMTDQAIGPARPRRIWPALLGAVILATGIAFFGLHARISRWLASTSEPRIVAVDLLPPAVAVAPMTDAGPAVAANDNATDAAPGTQIVTSSLPVQTSATIGINTRPSGAKVFIDSEQLEMLTPVRTQPITAGPHHVVIERVGYQPREVDVTLHAGEHRVFDFELTEDRPLQGVKEPIGKKHSTVGTRGNGFLTCKTVPWSRAYEGARLLGETPLVNVPLGDGPHTITFVNPDYTPIKKKVVIKVGEETKITVSLVDK